MTTNTVQDIEQAITQLSAAELDELYSWLADYQPEAIDVRIAVDIEAGRLDKAMLQAIEDVKSGNFRPL